MRFLLASVNPNQYAALREVSLFRVLRTLCIALLCGVLVLCALTVPVLLSIAQPAALQDVQMAVTMPTDTNLTLLTNPGITVSSNATDAFLSLTPTELTMNTWASSNAVPLEDTSAATLIKALPQLFLLLLPSILVWLYVSALGFMLVCAVIAGSLVFALAMSRAYELSILDCWKIACYAWIPSALLLGLLPVVRVGLPLSVCAVMLLLLWLVLMLLGSALVAEKKVAKGKGINNRAAKEKV